MTTASGRANRRRGADAERAVVAWLRDNGYPDARRYLAGDGRQPGDIDGLGPICLEVKDCASSAYPTWRRQLLMECPPGDVPVLVRRTRGVTDVGLWPAEMTLSDWWFVNYGAANPGSKWCKRTDRAWVRLPFGELVEALRP